MSTKEQMIAQQLAGAVNVKNIWSGIMRNVKEFGAKGDGVSNDTAAFQSAIDATNSEGRKAILVPHGAYFVTALTNADQVIFFGDNASFVGGYIGVITQIGYAPSVAAVDTPKYHKFGGQLSKLKASLANPLEQITGIVFIGDSITWGRTLTDNAAFDPRDGTLSDARDNFLSSSFVNLFKRYIGSNYAFNAAPVLSNWPASPSGQSAAEYTVEHILYPYQGDFNLTTTGTSTSVTEAFTPASITGAQLQLSAASSGTGEHTVIFTFTGDSFTFSFGATVDALDYELFVNGVSQGVFSATPGVDGVVAGNDNRREHTFGYVRNKTIEIKTVQAGYVGTGKLRVEGVIINKKIRITNQGIIGATTASYKTNNLAGNTSGDGEAVGPQDNYVLCQLGTNDRITSSTKPKGSNAFKNTFKKLLDVVTPLSDVILMCANPVENEDTSIYSFNMQRARDVVYRTAKENSLDMIDNYAVFNGLDLNIVTADGMHPNSIGHEAIFNNIINSLEMA
jgi:lysophospholipase L1-like esterase